MRSGFFLLAFAFVGGSGCTLARNAVHNLANETVAHLDEKKLSRQLRAEAAAAWAAYCPQAGGSFSEDFASGFRDGYADYLESGGNGSPPAVPPLRYRRSGYLNPEGHARIRDYFTGFKAGTDTAAASGRRQYLTVPVLMSDDTPPPTLPGVQIPAASPTAEPAVPRMPPPGVQVRAGERLPTPRPMDAATGLPVVGTGLPVPDRPVVQPLPRATPAVPPIPAAPPAADLQPAIPVVSPPQTRREGPPAVGRMEVTRVSDELPAAPPGTPLALPPAPAPDVPSLRRSIDRGR